MLKPHHFSFKCPLKISDLEQTQDGHFCSKCSKDIYDLTDCSIDEIIELQNRKGSLCGFVRAVSLTSMVGLAACSKSESAGNQNEQGNTTPEPNVPVEVQRELMGDVCIPEHEVPKPPTEETPPNDDSQVGTDAPEPQPAIGVKPLEIERPMIMGKICPPDQLRQEDPKPLDPNREGSPG